MTVPTDVLRAMFDHHLWATGKLIDHLGTLPPERLRETVPGTYGSILATLTHLVDADDRYLLRLRGPSLPPYRDRGEVPLQTLRADLDDRARRWDAVLTEVEAGTLEAAILGRDDYPDTPHAEAMLLLQAIHHGNDHRAQICSTLGALGLEVPELDGWEYWAEVRGPGLA
jgi:uncharacterized damage-inducible protein DinB